MISKKVKHLFHRVFTNKPDPSKNTKQEPKIHPYLIRRQERIQSQKLQKKAQEKAQEKHAVETPHINQSTSSKQVNTRKWKTATIHENNMRVQSNVNDLLKRALKDKADKSRVVSQPIQPIQPVHDKTRIENTPITPIRPNGDVKIPSPSQSQAPLTIDTSNTLMMNKDELAIRINSIPIRTKLEHDVYYNEYDNKKIPLVYGLHDCIYKSIIRVFLWYRGNSNTIEPIQTPNMRKHIDMIDMRIHWTEWIRIQRDLIHKETIQYKEHEFGRYSYPSWNTWRQCVRRIDNNRQLSTDTVALTIKETPTIQTMCQWLFDEYSMGCIVIPKIHIFTCLLIDSTLLLEWPFLFGVKDNHVYPIMNNTCCMDWIDTPSILESHYRNRRIKQKSFPTIEHNKTIKEKLLGMTQRKYDFLIDKHTRRQCTLLTIQNELNTQDFILVPFWSCDMMNTLRRAIYRMMRHSYAKKSCVFSKTWASHVESIFSFYEKEYTFMEI